MIDNLIAQAAALVERPWLNIDQPDVKICLRQLDEHATYSEDPDEREIAAKSAWAVRQKAAQWPPYPGAGLRRCG